jgi:O-antigen biosynthesis protein
VSSKRVTIVADELLGYVKTGGLGTGASFLALALARLGHRVGVLYVGASAASGAEEPWGSRYAEAGLSIEPLTRNANEQIEPSFFAQMRDVERALQADPPDVVVTQDLGAPTYTALRLRRLGLGFGDTRFVVNCYGTRRWITDMSAKARVLPGAHAVTVLERASLELADAVVSPSRYLVEWMRRERWQLPPETSVIPYYTLAAAAGDSAPVERATEPGGRVRRIAFFGRIEDRKGIAPFVEALNLLEPELLQGLELAFVGKATPAWPPERIEGLLSEGVIGALRQITFETDLDQPEAIASLQQPGTIALLPSFGETFGNAVRECLEHGVPFLASDAGAVPELVAREDWERTLFSPTAAGISEALRYRLTSAESLLPARTDLDDVELDELWADVLAGPSSRPVPSEVEPAIDVVVSGGSERSPGGCLRALAEQTHRRFRVLVVRAASQTDAPLGLEEDLPFEVVEHETDASSVLATALEAASADWILFLDHEDVPDPRFLELLSRAQAASGADVVSCGIEVDGSDGRRVCLFLGDPGGLGVLSNAYGTAALIRRSLLDPVEPAWRAPLDPDWPLLARLSAAGARIVSVPTPLLMRARLPGAIENDPAGALAVLQELERALPQALDGLARVAVGLAANAATPQAGAAHGVGFRRRVGARLSAWGGR